MNTHNKSIPKHTKNYDTLNIKRVNIKVNARMSKCKLHLHRQHQKVRTRLEQLHLQPAQSKEPTFIINWCFT